MRIVLTGGGSGGHILPFEPIIEALRTTFAQERPSLPARVESDKLEITFVGVVDEQAKALFESHNIRTIHIPSGKLRRYASAAIIPDILLHLPTGILKALFVMWKIMPDVVLSKGGYGSIPVVLAAVFYRIPTLLHESDAIMGMTNSFLGRFAAAIAVGFPASEHYPKQWQYKTIATGIPVRRHLNQVSKEAAKQMFQIPKEEFVLLVMGGSQGAQQINEAILSILPDIINTAAIIHITGQKHYKAVSTVASELLSDTPRSNMYRPLPKLTDKMQYALAAADATVSRAGASSLAEIARRRIPSLIIPLETAANDHQRKNAESFESAGAVLVLDPLNMGKHLFKLNIERLLTDESLRARLAKNLAAMDYPHASKSIALFAMKLAAGYAPKKPKTQKAKGKT